MVARFFIVTGIGVRQAESTAGPNLLVRERDRRQQYKLQIPGTLRPGWYDAALVFDSRQPAVDLYRRARREAPKLGRTIWATAAHLVQHNSELHPAWPGNRGSNT
jgi:hypothetical protein